MQYFRDDDRPGDPRVAPTAGGCENGPGAPPDEVDVHSAGTGPAGLLLAAQLSGHPGIVTVVVEQADGPPQVGRAAGVACRTTAAGAEAAA